MCVLIWDTTLEPREAVVRVLEGVGVLEVGVDLGAEVNLDDG